MSKLLLQDVHLLVTKWSDPEHLSMDESIGPQNWRAQYQQHLAMTIAQWLAKGLVTYQYPNRRMDAFVPVAHLVGTSRESTSYLDSLVEIAEELVSQRDTQYRMHPKLAFPQHDFVLLGECFLNAIGVAAVILAERLGDPDLSHQEEQCFQALLDALALIQATKPHNTVSSLCAVWSTLHDKSKPTFTRMSPQRPWVFEHEFLLALYPVCDIAAGSEIKKLLDALSRLTKKGNVPAVLKADIKACNSMISVEPPVVIKKRFAYQVKNTSVPEEFREHMWPGMLQPQHPYPDHTMEQRA